MIPLTLAEIAAAVGGELAADPDIVVTGPVEFDSRKIAKGGLFVAFHGERVDGHAYAANAVAAGAAAVLGSRPIADVPMVIVEDPQRAMGLLATAVLARLADLTVIAITGSSGKTTTKDLLAGLLRRIGPTVAPAGTLNNELGVPYTALQAGQETRFLVLEMGSRGPGHLSYLCQIARPGIGVVVNVGVAHIGEFGSVEAIAEAKGELPAAIGADGLVVLNADDNLVRAMAARTGARVVLAGQAPDATVRAVDVVVDERGHAGYTLLGPGGSGRVTLGVAGQHQVGNSLLAAAVAIEAGMSVPEVATALCDARLASERRMDVFDRVDGVTVIDDSYNANPASTIAALGALAAFGRKRRTIAVLGYLAELGEHERSGHEDVGRAAAELGIDLIVVVAEQAGAIGDGARSVSSWRPRDSIALHCVSVYGLVTRGDS